MKEVAPAGKISVAAPCLPSAKEGGIEGNEGILGASPALSMERITALCSRENHPPVRAGQFLSGPGGEMLRWAKRRWFFHELELYFHRCRKDIMLFVLSFCGGKVKGTERFDPTVWPARSLSPPGPDNPSEIMRKNKK